MSQMILNLLYLIFEILHTNTSVHLNISNHNNLNDIGIMDSEKADNEDENTHNYRNHFANRENNDPDKIVNCLIQFKDNNIKILRNYIILRQED